MKNAIVNIITFAIAILFLHFTIGLTTASVVGVSIGIFTVDLFTAIREGKD